jgi:GT2 family glycosyltransferase
MQISSKLVSVIISNWNGQHLLGTCLDSVFNQTYKNYEVIVVDNASSDDSVELVRDNYSQAKIIALKEDKGGPYADNLASSMSNGEYILLLNNDTIMPEDCLEQMVSELEKDEQCIINPVQLNWDGEYVNSGMAHPWLGYPLHRIIKTEGKQAFYPSLACCLRSRQLFQANPLNEHFFLYEDAEWGWRLHLKRIKIKVIPSLCFYHKGAGTIGGSIKQAFIAGQIAIATNFICLRLSSFLLLSPILFLDYAIRSFRLRDRPSLLKAYLLGFSSFLSKIRVFNADRKRVQGERLIGEWEMIKLIAASVDFETKAKKQWLSFLESR